MENNKKQAANTHTLPSVDDSWRKLGNLIVLFTDYVATQMGLTAIEFECQTIIHQHGPLTIGDLAARCKMSTGGMTKVVDRLERQGFARRIPDAKDRRRVLVEDCLSNDKIVQIEGLYKALNVETNTLLKSMTMTELQTVGNFLIALTDILEGQVS